MSIGIYLSILIADNAEYIIVEKLNKDITLTGRTLFWPIIVEAINRRPFFGYGYQGFWKPDPNPEDPSFPVITPNGFRPGHSHNGFLDVGVDFGWVGLGLFLISLLTNIYYGILHLNRCQKFHLVGLPLIIFTRLVISNYTETNIIIIASGWSFYVLMTARLSMDNAKN
jgi:O-antigen ligase